MRHAIVSSALFLAVVGAGVSWPGSTAANAHNAGPSVGPVDPALKRVPDGRAASAVLRGVNLSGGEFGTVHQRSNTNTYADGRDSQPPSLADLSYLARRGVRYVRVAFRQERLQPVLKGPLSPTGVSEVRRVLDDARRAGVLVTLDWHNYARFFAGAHELTLNTSAYPIEAFVDFNAKVGQAFKDEPSLFALSLTNEPHDLPPAPGAGRGPQGSLQPSTWEDASRRAVSAGRAAGYRGWYSVAADNWSSATLLPASHPHGWWINDPLEKSMLEVHYYPDWDNVGVFSHTYAEENKHALALGFTGQQDRVRRELQPAADWCRRYDLRCFLGETGWLQSRHRVHGIPAGAREAETWNRRVAGTIFRIADAAHFDVAVFTAGAYPSDYESLAYDLDHKTVTSMSHTIEEHLSVRRP